MLYYWESGYLAVKTSTYTEQTSLGFKKVLPFALIMPCKFEHITLIPLAISSISLAQIQPSQKICVADNFTFPIRYQVWLQKNGWEVHNLTSGTGPGAAKNFGISFLQNEIEFVTFHDADDLSHPLRFQQQFNHLNDNDLDLVGCQSLFYKFDLERMKMKKIMRSPKKPSEHNKIARIHHLPAVGIYFATILYRREVLTKVGSFNHQARGEDWDYFGRALSKGFKVGSVDQPLYLYQHPLFDKPETYRKDQEVLGKQFVIIRYTLHIFKRLFWSSIKYPRYIINDWTFVSSNIIERAKESREHLENQEGLKEIE